MRKVLRRHKTKIILGTSVVAGVGACLYLKKNPIQITRVSKAVTETVDSMVSISDDYYAVIKLSSEALDDLTFNDLTFTDTFGDVISLGLSVSEIL